MKISPYNITSSYILVIILNYKFNQTSQSTDSDGDLITSNLYCIGSVFADANNKIVKIDFKGNRGGCNNLKNKILRLELD